MFFSPIHSIMDKKTIIQWNCRGLRANYNEILIVSPAKQKRDICTAFPAASLSSSAAAA